MDEGRTGLAASLRQMPIVLLLLALFCQGLIAEGFMPDAGTGRMIVCDGGLSALHGTPKSGHQDGPGHSKAPCAYAMAVHQGLMPPAIQLAALPVIESLPVLPFSRQTVSLRPIGQASPRAPPVFS